MRWGIILRAIIIFIVPEIAIRTSRTYFKNLKLINLCDPNGDDEDAKRTIIT